jgi:hypothetical protein
MASKAQKKESVGKNRKQEKQRLDGEKQRLDV